MMTDGTAAATGESNFWQSEVPNVIRCLYTTYVFGNSANKTEIINSQYYFISNEIYVLRSRLCW